MCVSDQRAGRTDTFAPDGPSIELQVSLTDPAPRLEGHISKGGEPGYGSVRIYQKQEKSSPLLWGKRNCLASVTLDAESRFSLPEFPPDSGIHELVFVPAREPTHPFKIAEFECGRGIIDLGSIDLGDIERPGD